METMNPGPFILYAEDDIDDQEIFAEICLSQKPSIKLVTVYNGQQAIDYLENLKDDEPRPCLIVLDMNMPILDGIRTVNLIRDIPSFHAIPIALISTTKHFNLKQLDGIENVSVFTKAVSIQDFELLMHHLIGLCSPEVRKSLGHMN